MRKLGLLLLPVAAVACGDDNLTAKDVRSEVNPLIANAVSASVEAFASIEAMPTWQSVARSLDTLDQAFMAMPAWAPTLDQAGDVSPRQFADDASATDADLMALAITMWLNEHIFTGEQLESSTQSSATFLLQGENVCPSMMTCTWNDTTLESSCTEQLDQDCIAFVDQAQIRIEATLVGGGVDLALLIGPSRVNPLTVELRPDGIAAVVDLAASKAALSELAALAGEDIELPRVMAGRLRAALTVHGARDVSFSASILSAVQIEADGEHGPLSVTAAAADPLFHVRAQGQLRRLTAALAAGAVDIALPYADATPDLDDSPAGTLSIHLAGATYAVTLDDDQEELAITGVGLGDGAFTVKKDDTVLYALDLNASAGRAFDLTITPDAGGDSAVFTVSDELDVAQMFSLAAVAADFPSVESHFLDETYELRLYDPSVAGSASVTPVPPNDTTGFAGGLRVVKGQLSITSSAAPSESVVVSEGACLTLVVDPQPGSHPILGYLTSVTCP